MSQEKYDIEELLAKSLAGESTIEEQSTIEKWLEESVENHKTYADFKKIYNQSKSHYNSQPVLEIDVDEEWAKFNDTIHRKKGKVVSLKEENAKPNWMRVAAAISLMAISGFLIYNFLFKVETLQYQTASNKQEITLPDNSVVTLNANSELSYLAEFSEGERKLTLKGEAFFEVTPDKNRPFIIDANNATVTVLGTSFNVNTTTAQTEVIVATGLVQLTSLKSEENIKLNPGEVGVLTATDELTLSKNEDVNYNSWKTGVIVFKDADLVAVVNTLNRIYNSKITIAEEVSRECNVTVSFDQQSLESVLSVMEATLDLTIEKAGNKIIIIKAGC